MAPVVAVRIIANCCIYMEIGRIPIFHNPDSSVALVETLEFPPSNHKLLTKCYRTI